MKTESLDAFPLFLTETQTTRRDTCTLRSSQTAPPRQNSARMSGFIPAATEPKTANRIRVEALFSRTDLSGSSFSSGFEVVLIDRNFKRKTLRFSCEESLVKCLKETFETHAPVRLTYSDGSPIQRRVLDRIQRKLHQS